MFPVKINDILKGEVSLDGRTRYPNHALAQIAMMSLEGFSDLYFKVCNMDYSKLSKAMAPLVEMMSRTDQVTILGPGTDISFSIKGMGIRKCDGNSNLPDGEIYTAPVRDSMNGVVSYNTSSEKDGFRYQGTRRIESCEV